MGALKVKNYNRNRMGSGGFTNAEYVCKTAGLWMDEKYNINIVAQKAWQMSKIYKKEFGLWRNENCNVLCN